MGFWSTVLVALRFRSGQVPVVTDPLHSFRIRPNVMAAQRIMAEALMVQKIRNDAELVHRVRLEAR